MQQCRDMKRHERCATGFLIVMLWLQVSLRVTQAATIPEVQDSQTAVQPRKNNRGAPETVKLLTGREQDGKVVPALQEDGIYFWWKYSRGNKFKLEDNNTTLVVPKKGLYFVNLKMYYGIPSNYECKQMLVLKTHIEEYHPSYPEWKEVIKGEDTMQCVHHWHQSVSLSQVVRFEKGTKLRVVIDPKNYAFIDRDHCTYFSVTLL